MYSRKVIKILVFEVYLSTCYTQPWVFPYANDMFTRTSSDTASIRIFLYFLREWRDLKSSVALANVFFAFSSYLTENTVSIRKLNHGDKHRSSYEMSVIFVRI